MHNDSLTLEEKSDLHKELWPAPPAERGQGFKQFERYRALHESRLNEQGKPLSGEEIIRQWEEVRGYSSSRSISGNWQPLGPILDDVTTRDNIVGIGRMSCMAFHPSDPNIIFAGSPAGGLWRSFDGGANWSSNTDWLPTLGVASIAFDPTNPQIVYMGTGDFDASDAPGMGVMKSTDGGENWTFVNSGIESLIVPCIRFQPGTNHLFACTSDGLYKSTDEGATWVDIGPNNNDYEDLEFHPSNPQTIYVTTSGRLYISYDGGINWDWMNNTLGSSSRMLVAVTPAAPDYVYVLRTSTYEFNGFYRSTDAGLTFTEMSDSPNIMGWAADGSSDGGQAWYDLCLTADNFDSETVYVGGIRLKKSTDGGTTWTDINPNFVHVDQHYMLMSPHNNDLYVCNDGGLYHYDENTEWLDISNGVVTGQIYQLGQSTHNPNHTLTGFQDNGTKEYDGVYWRRRGGGDGFECSYDHSDPNWRYGSIYYGDIYRSNTEVNNQKICGYDVLGIDESGAWNTPYTLSKEDPTGNTMFVGLKNIWRTFNIKHPEKDSIVWERISDNLGGNNNSDINEIEICMSNPNIMYASEGSRKLFRTNNLLSDTVTWVTLSNQLPFYQTPVNAIETHPTDTNIVYICFHNDVYISLDQGMTWDLMTPEMPDVATNTIVMDTTAFSNEGLYVGTDLGVFYRDTLIDDWIPFNSGMPYSARVTELEIYYSENPGQHRLKASTYGRGLWESDLYSAETNNFPAVASVISSDPTNEVFGSFDVDIVFYRSLDETPVSEFNELTDIWVENATVSSIEGSGSNYTATIVPTSYGEVRVAIPQAAAVDDEFELPTFASDTISLFFVAAPEPLGPDGPGGVGDSETVALWLRADMQANGPDDQVQMWMDVSGNGYPAIQNNEDQMPIVLEEGINGQPALYFDGDNDCLILDDVVPGRSLSAYIMVEADSIEFNDHGWFASARKANGYLMHPWKNESQYHGDVYDLEEHSSEANVFYIGDGSAPHIYGMIYHQDDIHQVMTQVFDDNKYPHNGVELGTRDNTTPIDEIHIGWDYEERYGKGKIAEHFVYRTRLMSSHHQIVNNYMAAKYGIDLGPQTLYDHPDQNEEVIGIGRETAYDYHQEAQGKQIIRIMNPQSLGDGDYLLIGTDNASLTMVDEIYPIMSPRTSRTWGFDEKGDVGQVTIRILASDLEETENIGLIIAEGDEFIAGGSIQFFPLLIQGPVLEATVDLPEHGIFTIGQLPTIGAEDLSFASANVYPNPANDLLNFEIKNTWPQNWQVTIRNTVGQMVMTQTCTGKKSSIDIQSLSTGVYMADVVVNGIVIMREKVVVE